MVFFLTRSAPRWTSQLLKNGCQRTARQHRSVHNARDVHSKPILEKVGSLNPSPTPQRRSFERAPTRCFATLHDLPAKQNAVDLEINGDKVSLSPVFLRDLCSCPHCVDTSTKQKHFSTADIPANVRVGAISNTTEGISIRWENDIAGYGSDHQTEIPLALLQRFFRSNRTALPQPKLPRSLWDSRAYIAETIDFDYDAYMSDDSALLKAVQQLHTHGLLFVENVPESEESVEAVANRIGPLKTTFYGKTWDVRSVPNAVNVAYTSQNLGFHMDLMYMEQPPHLQLLHCIRSSAAGGASLFTDSFRAAVDLAKQDLEAFADLNRKTVDFHYDHPGSHYYHQTRNVIESKPVYVGKEHIQHYTDAASKKAALNPMDFIDAVSWAPPFQAPFSRPQGTAIPGDAGYSADVLNNEVNKWHQAAQKFNSLIHREEMIYERLMKPGECVIFDNRRVLHARRAFEVGDAGKERWLKGAYIDKDPYISKLTTLTNLGTESRQGADSYFEREEVAAAA